MKQTALTLLAGVIGCTAAPAADFATEMLEATHKLFHADSTGTCFLVRREAPDETLYVVTANHVLDRTKGDTAILVLREPQADGSRKRLDHTVAIRSEGKPLWVRHPDHDVAVLRLDGQTPVPVNPLPWPSLADEARMAETGMHLCSPLFVLTYPRLFEANEAGYAIARQGIIASHPFLPTDRHPKFFAEFTTFAGDSGGPVFVPGDANRPLVIGIVLEEWRHDETIKTEYQEITIHHPFRLGSVLHARFVRDTIEMASRRGEKASN